MRRTEPYLALVVYAVNAGFSNEASFMAAFSAGGLIFQWPVGWLSDRLGRRGMLLGLSIASFLLPWGVLATTDTALFLPLVILLGGAVMPMYSMCLAYLNDRIDAEKVVAASAPC